MSLDPAFWEEDDILKQAWEVLKGLVAVNYSTEQGIALHSH